MHLFCLHFVVSRHGEGEGGEGLGGGGDGEVASGLQSTGVTQLFE